MPSDSANATSSMTFWWRFRFCVLLYRRSISWSSDSRPANNAIHFEPRQRSDQLTVVQDILGDERAPAAHLWMRSQHLGDREHMCAVVREVVVQDSMNIGYQRRKLE